ncbi:hypothetical protein Dimus_012888 [Dionaea muscipula]
MRGKSPNTPSLSRSQEDLQMMRISWQQEGSSQENSKPFQRFVHFFGDEERGSCVWKKGHLKLLDLTYMDHLMFGRKLTRENGIWWIGSGENRRRDDDVDVPEEEAEEEDEGNKDDFDWEAVIDEATVEGESGSGEKFYDAEDKDQGSPEVQEEIPAAAPQSSAQQKERSLRVDPRALPDEFRKSEPSKFQSSLKEIGQTDFMMIWRRPKLRMPDF